MTSLEQNGFRIVKAVLPQEQIDALIALVEEATRQAGHTRGEQAYSLREVFDCLPQLKELVCSPAFADLLEPVLGEGYFAVRGLLFDKIPNANWKVPWHQDLTVAVRERKEAPGYGPWSLKNALPHVQPPTQVLEKMLTLRLHLDDCRADNGALRVLPGTHFKGKLSAAQIQSERQSGEEVVCEVPAGGALLMRPLLLHASSPANKPNHRRVLHFDFAAQELPHDLEWHCRVAH